MRDKSGKNDKNVLFIACDDLNGWIGPLGRYPGVQTPHIDRLAESGSLFRHAYCTAPHCSPSRTSVFSGLRPSTTGVYHEERLTRTPGDVPTLLEHFRANGYSTFGAGKVFHGRYDYASASKTQSPRAHWLDTHNEMDLWDEFHVCQDEPLPAQRPLNAFFDPRNGDPIPEWYSHFDWGPAPAETGETLPDESIAARAVEFLRRPHQDPFFCAVGFYRPHLPWYVPKRYFDLYPLDAITLPAVRESDLEDVPEIARQWALNPPDHELIVSHDHWRQAVQGYLASITFCDDMVGRVLDALDQSGLADDTIVVLWGDNGFHLGEKLHWRKFTLWEEATRVPLLIRAPGSSLAGHSYDEPVSLLDLYPTLAELCELPAVTELEGESLVPWLAPTSAQRASRPISTWGRGNHSLRSEGWRYTRYVDGSEELYDHRNDPYEWSNLARDEDQAQTKARLAQHFEALRL